MMTWPHLIPESWPSIWCDSVPGKLNFPIEVTIYQLITATDVISTYKEFKNNTVNTWKIFLIIEYKT